MYQSILNFNRARYFWVALALSLASVAAYVWHEPSGAPNGGTWLGYTLGTIGALLIVWLMLLGVRKRNYASTMGSVQGWTSAHVYLGIALVIVATLHGGFQFGLNIHTLAYALMVIVIVSGIFGLAVYVYYPSILSTNRAGDTLDGLLEKVAKIDARSMREAKSPELKRLVESAVLGCQIGGGVWQQLSASDTSTVVVPAGFGAASGPQKRSNRDQALVVNLLATRLSQLSGGSEAGAIQALLVSFATKQTLLRRIRRDIQIRALMKIWLFIHVPLSFALLAALLTHVIVVFFYW